jgi:hypothetical protein
MTKERALDSFWNSFQIPAYDEITVPDDASMPYITYEVSTAGLSEDVLLSASLWYQGMSWKAISEKKEEISAYIGGGVGQAYTGGRLWIRKSTPFAQRMGEPDDKTVRRILIQIQAEYQSAE